MGNDYEKVDVEGVDVTIGTDRRAEDGDARARVARRSASARRPHRAAEGAAPHLSRRRSRAHAADRDPGERQRHAVAAGVRTARASARPSSARRAPPQPRSVDQMIKALNKGAPQQHAVRQAARLGCRRGRQRRAAVVAAAVGARRARRRSQRRQLQPAAQRDARRMGAADRARRHRLADADDHRLAELMRSPSSRYAATRSAIWRPLALRSAAARVVAEVLPGGDADRFPQGRRREPLDRQPRPADARPGHRAGLRDVGAVSVVDDRASPTARCSSAPATRARSFASIRRARARCSSTAPSSRCTRSRRRPNGGLYVGTSPDGRIYKVDRNGTATTFFDSDDKYIWALAVDAKGNLFAGTGDKGVIYKIAPGRQRRAVLQDQRDARDGARVRQGRQPARRHRHAGQGAADRSGRQGVRPARFAVPGDPRAALRRQGHALRRGAERRGRIGGGADAVGRSTADRRRRTRRARRCRRCPPRSRRCRSSTSAAARIGGVAARGSPIARRAPSTASRPTASGISSGSRATTRRTT